MKIYLDTGFFIDYFSRRSMVTINLRVDSRRGRSIADIQNAADLVIKKLSRHESITSVISSLEYADNTFKELKKFSFGLPDSTIENFMKNKLEVNILKKRCERDNIKIIPLDLDILTESLNNPEYDELEIYDAIHIETARTYKVDIMVSTDDDLLKYDRKFGLRIVDSDIALSLL